jgi:hypothetical protein
MPQPIQHLTMQHSRRERAAILPIIQHIDQSIRKRVPTRLRRPRLEAAGSDGLCDAGAGAIGGCAARGGAAVEEK